MNPLYRFSPYIREVRLWTVNPLYGEWQDFDNVFIYIQSGEAFYIFNGQKYRLTEGDALVMYPFQKHVVQSEASTQLVQYIFHFDIVCDGTNRTREEVYRAGIENCYDPDNLPPMETYFQNKPFITSLNQEDRKIVEDRFLVMLGEYKSQNEGRELMLKSIALELLAIFVRRCNKNSAVTAPMSKSWQGVERALSYIHEHYCDPLLDNEMISRETNLTPNYLTAIFKKYIGMNLHQYVRFIRIDKAKKLIIAGSLNFSEIADRVGFGDIHIFSKSFKRITGKTPSEFAAMALPTVQNP